MGSRVNNGQSFHADSSQQLLPIYIAVELKWRLATTHAQTTRSDASRRSLKTGANDETGSINTFYSDAEKHYLPFTMRSQDPSPESSAPTYSAYADN